MDINNTASERLKILCETYYGGNKSKMGKTFGVSYQNINNYIEKGKKPSFEVMQKAFEVFRDKISADWLFLGEGEMFSDGTANPHAHIAATVSNSAPETKATQTQTGSISKQLLDYQGMIIELQNKLIRQLEK
jgi:DNA-binding XRE family transcriptional regulator